MVGADRLYPPDRQLRQAVDRRCARRDDDGRPRLYGGYFRVANAGRLLTFSVIASAAKQWRIFQTLRSEEHTSELQSLMRISYAVFCLKKKKAEARTNKHAYTHHKLHKPHTNSLTH